MERTRKGLMAHVDRLGGFGCASQARRIGEAILGVEFHNSGRSTLASFARSNIDLHPAECGCLFDLPRPDCKTPHQFPHSHFARRAICARAGRGQDVRGRGSAVSSVLTRAREITGPRVAPLCCTTFVLQGIGPSAGALRKAPRNLPVLRRTPLRASRVNSSRRSLIRSPAEKPALPSSTWEGETSKESLINDRDSLSSCEPFLDVPLDCRGSCL